jgi:hypothetical protein
MSVRKVGLVVAWLAVPLSASAGDVPSTAAAPKPKAAEVVTRGVGPAVLTEAERAKAVAAGLRVPPPGAAGGATRMIRFAPRYERVVLGGRPVAPPRE